MAQIAVVHESRQGPARTAGQTAAACPALLPSLGRRKDRRWFLSPVAGSLAGHCGRLDPCAADGGSSPQRCPDSAAAGSLPARCPPAGGCPMGWPDRLVALGLDGGRGLLLLALSRPAATGALGSLGVAWGDCSVDTSYQWHQRRHQLRRSQCR